VDTRNLFPVGRLDIDTEGLLLITDDGALSHNLLSPAKHVDKTYYAHIKGIADKSSVEAFAAGIDIGDDKLTKPAVLNIIDTDADNGTSTIQLTITEGRFHQVKRCFQALGMEVTYLKRLSMGSLKLDEALKNGEFRPLTQEEIAQLKNTDCL
jgi:16S rRNA pseudouridine516 synthase